MIGDDVITATGNITKEEELANVEHYILPNTLVLESIHPFPGYHGNNLPENLEPNTIYLVTDIKYEGDDILRASRKVRNDLPYEFDASFGFAELPTGTYHFIRMLGLNCFDCIGAIQKEFTARGIGFMKNKSVSGEARINIQKHFAFKKINEHVFQDIENPLMFYFEIPDKPDWLFFKKITRYIRGNIDNYSFDSALGAVYLKEIHDIVRIFGKDLTTEKLDFIRRKYLYELAHPDHLG